MTTDKTTISIVPWKHYIKITVESLLAFYVATFCVGMFFMHGGRHHYLLATLLIILYLFVIVICSKRVLEKLSLPALMLVIPIAPLIALIIVVTLIPILEYF